MPRMPLILIAALALLVAGSACVKDPMDASLVEAPLLAPPLVPPPTLANGRHVVVHLEAVEKEMEVAPGVTITGWTFNGTIPGPMIRVRVGDTVEVHLKNPASNTMSHNIDLHAVNGPGGGAGATTVAPGEEKAFTFKAKTEGLFVYHCAAGIVADHIANGMYGAILVDPPVGKRKVDQEYYVGQSDLYTSGDSGDAGHQDLDTTRLLAESPTYVVFNGHTKSLAGEGALQANVGDRVRIYFVDGGPNLTSSFHVIGEIFDRVWEYGALTSAPLTGVQTVLVPPGGATVAEFTVDEPGDYKLVDHAISRVSKGALGILHVEGPSDADTFQALENVARPGQSSRAAAAPSTPTPADTPAAPSPTEGAVTPSPEPQDGAVTIDMTDNRFAPDLLTIAAGTPVTFALSNDGKVPHNMRIAPANGNFDDPAAVVSRPDLVSPGKAATLSWTPTVPGTYKFRCDIHPDQMTGTITVR